MPPVQTGCVEATITGGSNGTIRTPVAARSFSFFFFDRCYPDRTRFHCREPCFRSFGCRCRIRSGALSGGTGMGGRISRIRLGSSRNVADRRAGRPQVSPPSSTNQLAMVGTGGGLWPPSQSGLCLCFRLAGESWTETSLSGRWGGEVGATPVGLAAAKLTAIGLLTPLLLFTRSVGPVYLRALRYLGLSIYFVPVYVYLGLYHGYFFVDRRARSVLNPHSRQRWIDRTRAVILQHLPENLSSRWNRFEDAGSASPTVSETDEEMSLWADTDPGIVPSWSPDLEPVPPNGTRRPDRKVVHGASSKWKLPTVDLLTPPETHNASEAPLEKMARHIESTLSDHGGYGRG